MLASRLKIFNAAAGFCIACMAISLAGAIFRTSPSLYTFEPSLGFAVRQEGSFKQERNENWVTNRYGKLGLEVRNAKSLSSHRAKVLLLGDSYIEAAMIPGPRQMQNLVKLPAADCLAVGYSGIGSAEYCYLMHQLPRAIPKISAWIIFIGDVYDLKGESLERCRKNSLGALPRASSSLIDRTTARLRLYSLRALLRRWRLYRCDFLGNRWLKKKDSPSPVSPSSSSPLAAVCQELKQAAGGRPLLFVYAPHVPQVRDNRVGFEDEEKAFGRELEKVCGSLQIGFINLEKDFVQFYRRTGKFPRGFFNTPPSKGHLNEAGHAIAASAVSRYFQEKN